VKRDEHNRYPWLVLSVTSLGVLLIGINAASLNVALPTIVQAVHANPLEANWILLSYMLVNTVLVLVFGRMADMFGRRALYLIGFAIFTVCSLLLGFSPNALALIAFRAGQAAGGALVVTNTTPIITDVFPRAMLGQALGLNVSVISIAQLVGPPVGGFFAATGDWRWVFWFNVPLGVLGFLWAARSLRPMDATDTASSIDLTGAVLAFLALGGLLVGLSEGGVQGWVSPSVLVGVGMFAVAFPLFVWVQWRGQYPMIDLTLFRDKAFTMANLAVFLNSAARFSPVLLVALFLQAARGETPLDAGLRVLPVSIGMMVASPLAGQASRWYSTRLLATAGLGITALGLLILAVGTSSTPAASYLPIGLGLSLTGFGSGFFMTPNTTFIMSNVPLNRRGTANGLRSTLQNAAIVISTALSLGIATGGLPSAAKTAAYSGNLSRLAPASLEGFVRGYRVALLVMFSASVLGMIASSLRLDQTSNAVKKT
jgi:EmrB/QacA subfamily drug resistance transporter